jgi:hypothetical protein
MPAGAVVSTAIDTSREHGEEAVASTLGTAQLGTPPPDSAHQVVGSLVVNIPSGVRISPVDRIGLSFRPDAAGGSAELFVSVVVRV